MDAVAELAGVRVAEIVLEEGAPERLDHVPRGDLVGGSHQAVAAARSAGALDELALPEHAHQLAGVLGAEPLGLGDLGDGDRAWTCVRRNLEQAAQAEFFLGE